MSRGASPLVKLGATSQVSWFPSLVYTALFVGIAKGYSPNLKAFLWHQKVHTKEEKKLS